MGTLAASVRSQKWDILKFLLIFLVVLGHAADYYILTSEPLRSLFIIIYTFHMPVFVFVSGLFAKNTVNEKRFDRMAGYLILYLLVKLYPFAYRNLFGQAAGINFLYESGIPWFMLALFWFNLLTVLIKKLPAPAVLSVSVLLACVAGYSSEIGDFLAVSRTVVYYPFFYLGYCLDRQALERFCEKKSLKAVAALVFTAFCVTVFILGDRIYWFRPLLTGRNPFSALGDYSRYGFLIRLAYYAVVFIVGLSVVVLVPKCTPKGFAAKLGQRTLAVYALHFIVFFLIYEKFDCRDAIESIIGKYDEWTVVPISAAVTMFFSLKIFNDALTFMLNLPSLIYSKLKN